MRTGKRLARVTRARSFLARTVGLLGRRSLPPGEALWLDPCPQVHTFFMAFPIDVLFLDGEGTVVRVLRGLVPWRVSPWVGKARSALEMTGGASEGKVREGDRLEFVDG